MAVNTTRHPFLCNNLILKQFMHICCSVAVPGRPTVTEMADDFDVEAMLEAPYKQVKYMHCNLLIIYPVYHKNQKYSDTSKSDVIILKFEQYGFTIEPCILKILTEWQTV